MMDENSTTATDNSDAQDTSTNTESNATDNKTGDDADNLDSSKSTDTSAGEDNSQDDKKDDKTPAPKFDTDLDEWAEKTGRQKPESDRERELYQEIRNGQREYSRDKQQKQALKEANTAIQDATATAAANKQGDDDDDDEEDPLAKRTSSLESQLKEERDLRARSEFFTANEVTPEVSKTMGEILKEKVDRAAKRGPDAAKKALDFWTDPDNLADWHALAKARMIDTDTTQIETEAARKERERIAKESQANGPSRNASNNKSSDKTEDQKRLERFSNWG